MIVTSDGLQEKRRLGPTTDLAIRKAERRLAEVDSIRSLAALPIGRVLVFVEIVRSHLLKCTDPNFLMFYPRFL